MEASKELLLQHHYIGVVNLHEYFPSVSTQQERISMFLDCLRRGKEVYDAYNESWDKIDIDRKDIQAINTLASEIENVYALSQYI